MSQFDKICAALMIYNALLFLVNGIKERDNLALVHMICLMLAFSAWIAGEQETRIAIGQFFNGLGY